jgi:hypothetical protein
MFARLSELIHAWMGWCPNAPAIHTAPSALVVTPGTIHPAEPGSSGPGGSSGRVRSGIHIAMGSLKAMLRDRRLLWFSVLASLVMLFLIVVEEWTVAHIQSSMPFLIAIPVGNSFLMYPFLIFDTRLFLVELVCLSCFTILLAALVLYRNEKDTSPSITIRKAFAGVGAYAGPLATLSGMMALSGTLLYEIISQSQFFGKIVMTISMAVFYLPYAYYLPDTLSAAIFISVIIMFINIILFLVALYVVPVIVLEKKGLVPALAGSLSLMKKTWRELLGCAVIYSAIVLVVAAIALVIGQSPYLLNHDFDFFINMSRGQLMMMTVCFLFLTMCWVMMAAGFTAGGIAITDLYACGKTTQVPENFKKN